MKIRPFVAALLLILSVCSSPVSAGDLEARLLEMSKQIDGRVALYARNLDSGREVGINADEPVRTASTIKLPIACAVCGRPMMIYRQLSRSVSLLWLAQIERCKQAT